MLRIRIDELEKALSETRAGYRALDDNWAAVHEGAMRPIRAALGNRNATVPEMEEAITAMKAACRHVMAGLTQMGGDWSDEAYFLVEAALAKAEGK